MNASAINPNKITIVTVCFNSAAYIERAIDSVLQQSYKNIEYIIIDGGSTDGTVDIINKYDPFISYWVSEPDNGIYHAMNKGIRVATGDLIGFLSSNDWYADGAIKAIADRYEETHADVVYGDAVIIDGENATRHNYNDVRFEDSYYYMPIIHPSFFVRTDLQKRYGFDESYLIAADYKFYMQLYHDGCIFAHTKHDIIHYYLGGASSELEKVFAEDRRAAYEVVGRNSVYADGIERYFFENLYNHLDIFVKNGFSRQWIRKKLDAEENIYMFGLGNIGRQVYECLQDAGMRILGFADNAKEKQGTEYKGLPIYAPERLQHLDEGIIVISSYDYAGEMEEQLINFKIQDNVKLIRADILFTDMVNDYIDEFRRNP